MRFNHASEVKRWTRKANRSDERLRSYRVGEGQRWTVEIRLRAKEMCRNGGVGLEGGKLYFACPQSYKLSSKISRD